MKKRIAAMTAFPHHQEGDIDNIIAHTSEPKAAPAAGCWELLLWYQINGSAQIILYQGALVLVLLYWLLCFLVNNVLKSG
jgi:hypothetical protein